MWQGRDAKFYRAGSPYIRAQRRGLPPACDSALMGLIAGEVTDKTAPGFMSPFLFGAAFKATTLTPEARLALRDMALRIKPDDTIARGYYLMLRDAQIDLTDHVAATPAPAFREGTALRTHGAFFRQLYLVEMSHPGAEQGLADGLQVIASQASALSLHLKYLQKDARLPKPVFERLITPFIDDGRRPAGVNRPGKPISVWVREQLI